MKKSEKTLLSDEVTANHQAALLRTETDRGCALVGGAMVDEALGDLLHAVFNDTKGAWTDLLDGGMAPLKNFGARAQVAHALGLIPTHDYDDIVDLKWIRNKAAHLIGTEEEPFSFALKEVAERTTRMDHFLEAPEQAMGIPRRDSRFIYMGAVVYLTIRLLDKARHIRESRTADNRGAVLGALIDDVAKQPKPKVTVLMNYRADDETPT